MAKTIKKNRKSKKMKTTGTISKTKLEWIRGVWICDSSVHEKTAIFNASKILGMMKQPAATLLNKWTCELNSSPFKWRFAVFGFNFDTQEVSTIFIESVAYMSALDLMEIVMEQLEVVKEGNDSWGLVGTPTQEGTLEMFEDYYTDQLVEMGVTNTNHIELVKTRKKEI